MAILSNSEPLQWEKIGKVANHVKLDNLGPSEPLWWKRLEKLQIRPIGHSKSFGTTSVGKDWKSCNLGEIGRSK